MREKFEELKYIICGLVFNYNTPEEIENDYEIDVCNLSLYRNFNSTLISFHLYNKASKYAPAGEHSYHIMIDKNYDIFLRPMPYYDGDLSDLHPVHNVVKIYFLIKENIPQLFNNIKNF